MSLGDRIKEMFLKFFGFFVPLVQFVPNTWMFMGLMSMPLISYLSSLSYLPHLWRELYRMIFGFRFLFLDWQELEHPFAYMVPLFTRMFLGKALFFGGLFFLLYSLGHFFRNRGGVVRTGPYSIVRHPQYLGLVLMTSGITLLTLRYEPVFVLGEFFSDASFPWYAPIDFFFMLGGRLTVVLAWVVELAAYLLLARLEETYLVSKYPKTYLLYRDSTPFILPKMSLTNRMRHLLARR